ncbi:DUF11 domain-containing protein [Amycolatopsis samaneae]|uniref:DUF11 domain-containing protein n=1 Tax=Amycolatopsis samaneae TaxID=664691 RepID=A0ABW5GLN5_9PSEU
MTRHRRWRRFTTIALAVAAVLPFAAAPASADDVPSSAVTVGGTTLHRGQTFTVTQQVHNTQQFTVTFAKAAIYGQQTAITDLADLVSCTGTTAPCFLFGSSYRAPFGDLAAGESRTVVYTLKVKDTAPLGTVTLQHQLVGDNYAFDTLPGPELTVTQGVADLGVRLTAAPHGLLSPEIDYTITLTNAGPGDASGVRVVATYSPALQYTGSAGCAHPAGTSTVTCDVAALAAGSSATLRFGARLGVLSLGSFTTTARIAAAFPADPNAANNSATRTCTAVTGLLVSC